MPDNFIDLGISHDPETTVEITQEAGPRKTYPCVYITSPEAIDFGDAGTAEIKYKLVEKTERNRDGKDEYRYELEVRGISPQESMDMEDDDEEEEYVKPKKAKGLTQNFGDMLDKAKKSREEY
jgi:hypothetical protein